MELRDYVNVLRKGWLLILGLAVLGTAAGVVLTVLSPKIYRASVLVFVSASDSSTSLAQGNNFTQDRVQTYTNIATTSDITSKVVDDLGLTMSPSQLADNITATAPSNKVLINLAVTDRNAQQAARIANEVGTVFVNYIPTIDKTTDPATGNSVPSVALSVVERAGVPSTPISPRGPLNVGLGLAVGLVLGILIVSARAALDNTVKTPEDFDKLGVPVLGLVPMDKRASRSIIAFRADTHSARSEAYRQVRTNLQFVDVDNPPRLIAVTSAMPGEGKTTTAINLAAALAEAGYRVCLIDSDLRRPSIADKLGLIGDVGFTSVLIGETPVESVLQNAGRNLAVLASGPLPPNPSELLISDHARDVITGIAALVDFTIVDTPPLLPVSDAAEIATLVDATLFVARAGSTTKEQITRAVGALAKVGERPVGVILNMVTRSRGTSGYQYGYYYAPYRSDEKKGSKTETAPAVDATPRAVELESAESADGVESATAAKAANERVARDQLRTALGGDEADPADGTESSGLHAAQARVP